MCREKALRSLGDLPPFSPILSKLLASLAFEDVSFARVAELIEKDTVLGNVLRLVNSALYGRRGTVSSVRHAVSLMGLVKLRNSVMTLSMAQLWSTVKMPRGWKTVRFNQHAVATAVMADLLAQKVRAEYPEGAFVAGLLHDIGLLLIGITFPDEFAEIRTQHEKQGKPLAECEQEILGIMHTEISTAVLHKWNLPEAIQKAVRYQNEPSWKGGDEYPLSWILHVADQVVCSQGTTIFTPAQPIPIDPVVELDKLSLGSRWEQLEEEFERDFEPMRSFF